MDRDDELSPRPEPSRDELDALIGLHHPQPPVRAINQAVGLVDELGRLLAAAVLGVLVLVILATTVSVWFWVGVALWVANIIATIVWLRRRRRPPQRELNEKRD